jgi:hypothetical protein
MMIAVGLAASAISASAASLGGISAGPILSHETTVTIPIPPPPPLVQTDFSGCSNSIDGWVDESGAQWTSHSGDWQCLGSNVVRAQQREPLAHLTVDIPFSTGIRITAGLEAISDQNNRSGPGLALYGDGAGHLIYVFYERDQNRLTFGMSSPTAGNVVFDQIEPISDLATATFSAEIDGTSLAILVNGTPQQTYDLSVVLDGADQAYFLSNTRFGLLSDNDNFSRFNSFMIEVLA